MGAHQFAILFTFQCTAMVNWGEREKTPPKSLIAHVLALKAGFTNNGAALERHSALFKWFPLDLVSYNLQKVALTKWPVERIFLSINDVYVIPTLYQSIQFHRTHTSDQWVLCAIEFHSSFMLKYQLFMKINLHFVCIKLHVLHLCWYGGTWLRILWRCIVEKLDAVGNSISSVNSVAQFNTRVDCVCLEHTRTSDKTKLFFFFKLLVPTTYFHEYLLH